LPVVTSAFIEEAHKQNKFVHVWTIDEENEMNRLIKLGVDGLMTDKPSILKKVMEENELF
jgi:glycerophosphoryl diester phosphodiesterase